MPKGFEATKEKQLKNIKNIKSNRELLEQIYNQNKTIIKLLSK